MTASMEARKNEHRYKALGKSDARKQFLPLVNSIAHGAGPVEITDYGKVVAVLLSKNDFDWMRTQTSNKSKPRRSLYGLGQLLGDLKEGSQEIAESLQTSLNKTAHGI